MSSGPAAQPPISRRLWSAWWPLAASWLLMGVELPAVSAVVARLGDPEVHLAAYGGVVFPLAMLIEAPIIMLLSTSTALSRDWPSYRRIRRFTHTLGALLTALHVAIAFTPIYDFVVGHLLEAPPAILEPGRTGLRLMTPWTWAIASRRFQQGVLIRHGRSRAVGIGTLVRLLTGASVLAWGALHRHAPGIVVAASAVACAVVAEAIYVALRVQPVLRQMSPEETRPLSLGTLIRFHTPLALTSLLQLAVLPIGAAALGRMPLSLASLAAWPVIHGLAFFFRSVGFAYNEVVVVHLDDAEARPALVRFALLLAAVTSGLMLITAATPLGRLWLSGVSGLSPELSAFALPALWLNVPLPALAVLVSLYQGELMHGRRTRAVSEAVAISLCANVMVLGIGVATGRVSGLFVAVSAAVTAGCAQVAWLRWRARAMPPAGAAAVPPA